jgi:hypothetical protein
MVRRSQLSSARERAGWDQFGREGTVRLVPLDGEAGSGEAPGAAVAGAAALLHSESPNHGEVGVKVNRVKWAMGMGEARKHFISASVRVDWSRPSDPSYGCRSSEWMLHCVRVVFCFHHPRLQLL